MFYDFFERLGLFMIRNIRILQYCGDFEDDWGLGWKVSGSKSSGFRVL